VEGALAGVVEMRLRLHSLPFVHENPIELAARLVDPAALVEGHEVTATDTAEGGDDG
jgi:hypothetical protein